MPRVHLFTLSLLSAFPLTLSAQRDTVSLNEVVVTGARTEINRQNVPMTISVISRRDIEESGESALLPVLAEQIPGLFVTERGITGFGVSTGASGGITMRGVGGTPTTGVLVLIDGHPQYMGLMGHHLPDAYATAEVEKAEVIRGPASTLYGSNAMGGAINIITRKQKREGWNANARLMLGSFNTQKYMVGAGLKKGKYDGFVSVNRDHTNGHRNNSAFSLTNGHAQSDYAFSDKFNLRGDISLAAYKSQNPGTESAPMLDNIADILRGAASVTLDNRLGKNDGALKVFYNFGEHKINDGYLQNGGTPPDSRFRSNDKNYGASLYQNFRIIDGNLTTGGIDFKTFGGRARTVSLTGNPDTKLADTTVYELAGYLIVQQTLFDKLTFNGGIRFDYNEITGGQWLPQFGFACRPANATVIKASVAKSFRNPTIRELFMFAPQNPDLKPEKMLGYELSVEQQFFDGRLTAELTGFVAKGSNMIVLRPPQPPAITLPLYVNSGDFRNRGIEMSLYWQAADNLHIRANYSYINTKKPIIYTPRHKAYLSANYRLNKWSVSGNYQFIGKMYSDAGSEPSAESYGLINAKISCAILKYLHLFVKGENLSGKNYQIMNGYPMPGLIVLGGLSVEWGR
ncbi:MAG: TonB-dependent receptor [Prevotella sp.]|jgi:iron complex outermembrane receptor protein|nr:TonB-dependent receptor [Prevotella sp.]